MNTAKNFIKIKRNAVLLAVLLISLLTISFSIITFFHMQNNIASKMFEHLGHNTFQALNGEETVKIFTKQKKSKHPIDLIIMDLTIPGGMGGVEAIKEILKIDSNVKVIVTSGYTNDPVLSDYKKYGFKASIIKPFLITDLDKIITKIFG